MVLEINLVQDSGINYIHACVDSIVDLVCSAEGVVVYCKLSNLP